MDFSRFLKENSLFVGNNARTQLVDDTESVMDSLVFNYFGYLGLVKLNNKANYLNTYQKNDKTVTNVNNIGDDSNDVSLAVKLAFDAGAIKQATVTKMIRLLQEIRQKKITSDNLDEVNIRIILDEIRYTTNKPSTRVLQLLKDFHSGAVSLVVFTKKLYTLAKMKDYAPNTMEFRDLVIKGKFNTLFNDLSDIELNSPNLPSIDGAAKPIAVETQPIPKEIPKEKELPDLFFKNIFGVSSDQTFDYYLSKFNLTRETLFKNHSSKIVNWLNSHLNDFKPTMVFNQIPLFGSHPDGAKLLSIIINNEIKTFAANGDIDGFLKRVASTKNYLQIGADLLDRKDMTTALEYCRQLTKAFYEKKVDTCAYNINDIFKLGTEAESLFNSLTEYTLKKGEMYYQYENQFIGDTFNKRFSIGLTSRILDERKLLKTYRKDFSQYIEKAFGPNSSSGDKTSLDVTKEAFDKADQKLKDAFQNIFNYQFGKIIGIDIISDWVESIKELSYVDIERPKDLIKPDISETDTQDLKKVADRLIKELSDDELIYKFKCLIGFFAFDRNGRSHEKWFNKNVELTYELINQGKLINDSIFFSLSTNNDSCEKALKVFDKNLNNYKDLIENTSFMQMNTYLMNFGYRSQDNINKFFEWISQLQNSGRISLKNVQYYRKFLVSSSYNFYLPFMKIDNFGILEEFQAASEIAATDYFDDYMQWLFNNQREILKYYVKLYEQEASFKRPEYIKYIDEKNITDKIIQNFVNNIWPAMWPNKIAVDVKYYKSKKMQDALVKYVLDLKKLDVPPKNMHFYMVPILPLLTAEQFNEEVKDISKSGNDIPNAFLKMTSWIPDVLADLIDRISKKPELTENIDAEVFNELIKIGDIKDDAVNDHVRNQLAELARKVKINDESKIDVLLSKLQTKMRGYLIKYLVGAELGEVASKEIFRDDVPIKPYEKLDENRIAQILKYNKVSPDTKLVNKVKSSNDINKLILDFTANINEIKATLVEGTPEYFERKTIEYDVFNRYRHGKIAPKILREFDVNLPNQLKLYNKFLTDNEGVEIMDPVFHGTGSIAASMILRYGFAVISSNDSLVVSRMLGNGIYFSTVIDKVSQYTSDYGYTRGIGTKGYIFRMKAALGQLGKDYDSAGVIDNETASPEWVVFHPEKQLLIYKAFEVEIVTKDTIDKLKKKHNINEATAVEIKTFKEFLRESESELYKHATTFTFIDGNIPISKEKFIPFEEFNAKNFGNHVRLETSQLGPMVTIYHNDLNSQAFCVRYTSEFMHQKELKNFLNLLQNRVIINN